MKYRAILITILACLISSCIGMPELKPSIEGALFTEAQHPANGNGGLYIFRPLIDGYMSSTSPDVHLNGELVSKLPFGAYKYIELPEGSYELKLSTNNLSNSIWYKTHQVNVVSEQKTYVAIWATRESTQRMGVLAIPGSPVAVVPTVITDTHSRSVFIEVVSEDLAMPELRKCVSIN